MMPPYSVIDAHIHIQPWEMLHEGARAALQRGRDTEQTMEMMRDPDALVRYMDAHHIEQVAIINYAAPGVMGFEEAGVNEFSSRYATAHPDRIIPFGGIDPHNPDDIDSRLDHMIDDLGLRGIKIHPPHQLLYPNAYRDGGNVESLAVVYQKASDARIPVMIHTGTSVFPGARNKYADPMALDDVAVDFPNLTIILAHGGRPIWMDSAYFLLRRHPNIWFDISSVPPSRLLHYFPWLTRVADKTIFGSDWPGPGVPSMHENIEAFYELELPEEMKQKILRENARRLFG
ncbi:MAG: amidohydrolase family protein [Chloroflexota bacterium]|nr:amidohydrolase family protein [Chloroflexota bacterium]